MITNPFKFGSIVEEPFFTKRHDELGKVQSILSSNNHVIIISPRRFGKTSLIRKAVKSINRDVLMLDLQLINSIEDFAAQYLRRVYRVFPSEKIKQFVRNFRIMPTISLNPVNGEIEVSFKAIDNNLPLLEDVLNLMEQLSSPSNRTIVILDEFQEIIRFGKGIDRKLRSIMQLHQNINYVFLGSQESMMREIFEKKKSPFYHFGLLLPLTKIEKTHFRAYINAGMSGICSHPEKITDEVLDFTDGHPYYTQQLAYSVWNNLKQSPDNKDAVGQSIVDTIQTHDFDYERLWATFNNTDKNMLTLLAQKNDTSTLPLSKANSTKPTSTIFSSIKRLMANGAVLKTNRGYEIDDPFFTKWIITRRNN